VSGRAVRWLLSLGLGAMPRRGGPARLTIVRHHRVYADGERRLYHLGVSESVFARQLEVCAAAKLLPVTVREGLARLRAGTPGHVVAFTFDDGYADNITRALPVLRRFGARGTFYLTAGLMDEQRAPWWDELAHALEHGTLPRATVRLGDRELTVERSTPAERRASLGALLPLLRVTPAGQRVRLDALREALGVREPAPCELAGWELARALVAGGMEVGAHTLNHPFLSLLPPAEQSREMAGSAAMIRERLGAEVTGIAYPNGDHDAHTIEAARAAGFDYAVSTRSGDCDASAPALSLPRRPLTEGGCTGPGGRFSAHMTLAEINGAFDRLRAPRAEVSS
jgi:peptidoglycan/xylan/chitin deacetylase (PgdA/CDA1 family)